MTGLEYSSLDGVEIFNKEVERVPEDGDSVVFHQEPHLSDSEEVH